MTVTRSVLVKQAVPLPQMQRTWTITYSRKVFKQFNTA